MHLSFLNLQLYYLVCSYPIAEKWVQHEPNSLKAHVELALNSAAERNIWFVVVVAVIFVVVVVVVFVDFKPRSSNLEPKNRLLRAQNGARLNFCKGTFVFSSLLLWYLLFVVDFEPRTSNLEPENRLLRAQNGARLNFCKGTFVLSSLLLWCLLLLLLFLLISNLESRTSNLKIDC